MPIPTPSLEVPEQTSESEFHAVELLVRIVLYDAVAAAKQLGCDTPEELEEALCEEVESCLDVLDGVSVVDVCQLMTDVEEEETAE